MIHTKYDNYKNSNIYWVGDIPNHWEVIPVKHHFYSKKQVAGDLADNYQRLALTLNGVIKRSKKHAEGLQPEKFETYQIVRKCSLIFKLIDLENINTSRVGLSKWDGLVSPAYIILSSNGNILPNYAEKYFLNMWYERIFNQLGSVGVRSNLNKEDVLNLPIIKPPLEEQSQINNYLDKRTNKLDETISKNQKLIELLEEKRIALINKVVTKGLNPDVPMKDSGIEWIGEIPEHWNVTPLSRYTNVTKLAGFEFTKHIEYNPDGEIIALRALNIKNNKLNLNNIVKITKEVSDKLPRSKLYKEDLIFTYVGAKTGAVALIDKDNTYHLAPNIAKICNISKDKLITKFLLYNIASHHEQEEIWFKIAKSGQEAISMEKIRTLSLVIPSFEEQNQIVEYLDKELTKINTSISKINENINLLEEYKTSLIHHVVTGKIDVRGEKI